MNPKIKKKARYLVGAETPRESERRPEHPRRGDIMLYRRINAGLRVGIWRGNIAGERGFSQTAQRERESGSRQHTCVFFFPWKVRPGTYLCAVRLGRTITTKQNFHSKSTAILKDGTIHRTHTCRLSLSGSLLSLDVHEINLRAYRVEAEQLGTRRLASTPRRIYNSSDISMQLPRVQQATGMKLATTILLQMGRTASSSTWQADDCEVRSNWGEHAPRTNRRWVCVCKFTPSLFCSFSYLFSLMQWREKFLLGVIICRGACLWSNKFQARVHMV